MQYNFPHFRIDRKDFLKGSNSYENYPDGGFVTSTYGYNSFSKPGMLANIPSFGGSVTGGLPTGIGYSTCLGGGASGQTSMVVGSDGSSHGYFYTVNGTTGSLTQVGSADTAHNYPLGRTDTIFYKGSFYTTSAQDITKNSLDLTVRDTTWWTVTKAKTALASSTMHPQVVFGDIHYIADGTSLHQNDNGVIQTDVLSLGDYVITAMCVYNNLIYIAAESFLNFSGAFHGSSKIFTWDGYSVSYLDEWDVNHHITAMYVFKNILYVWSKKYMGYFTGSTVKNLYPMSNQIFKHQITETVDSMYFSDGSNVIRYGSPYLTGDFKFFRMNNFGNTVFGICSPSTESLLVMTGGGSNGSNLFMADVNGTPAGTGTFKLNRRRFNMPARVRGYVIYTSAMSPGQYVEVSYKDSSGNVSGVKRFGYSVNTKMQGKQEWRFDVSGVAPTTMVDPIITIGGDVYLEAVDFLYEASESKLNA